MKAVRQGTDTKFETSIALPQLPNFVSRILLLISALSSLHLMQVRWVDLVLTIQLDGMNPFMLPGELRMVLPLEAATNAALPYPVLASIVIWYGAGAIASFLSKAQLSLGLFYNLQSQVAIWATTCWWLESFGRVGARNQLLQDTSAYGRLHCAGVLLLGAWVLLEVLIWSRKKREAPSAAREK